MTQEAKICQNCKKEFVIDSEDFQFYERMKVPPPTFCPRCRFQRRLLFWNAINLYKRPCDLCGKFNISVYPPEAPYTVYCPLCWWSDDWDPKDYSRDYDFSRPFFEQLNDLWHEAPHMGLSIDFQTAHNSPYNHDAGHLKNCYLIFNGETVEDSAYGYFLGHSQYMFDCTAIEQCQFGYDAMHSYKTNRCIGSRHQLAESLECLFCRDSVNSQNCFVSANLKNKKYYAWNKPLTREEYMEEVKSYDLGSYAVYKELQKKVEAHWATQIPKSEYNEFVTNCTGPNIFFSKNAKDCIEVYNAEDCRYLFRMFGPSNKNCYDVSMWGNNLSLSYECLVAGENSTLIRFSAELGLNLTDAEYCKLSIGGLHHFGCLSMKKGDYAILNKQYSKEEYEKLTARIRAHMDEMPYISEVKDQNSEVRKIVYKYGEFFPPEMSPFAYNTTLAQNFFPLTAAEAKSRSYRWREPTREEYETTMHAKDLPDHIQETPDSILNERIACAKCGRAYRIIEMEFQFHKQMNVPLPRECPFCRINEKLNLWVKNLERNKRTCADCGATMESKYREDERPKVYCRPCYLARID